MALQSFTGGPRFNTFAKRLALADDESIEIPLEPGQHKIVMNTAGVPADGVTMTLDTAQTSGTLSLADNAFGSAVIIHSATSTNCIVSKLSIGVNKNANVDTDDDININLNTASKNTLHIKNRLGSAVSLDLAVYSVERS